MAKGKNNVAVAAATNAAPALNNSDTMKTKTMKKSEPQSVRLFSSFIL